MGVGRLPMARRRAPDRWRRRRLGSACERPRALRPDVARVRSPRRSTCGSRRIAAGRCGLAWSRSRTTRRRTRCSRTTPAIASAKCSPITQADVAFLTASVTIARMVFEVVAREKELASLQAFIGHATEGPAALVIEGDAGIGKSTLWLAGVEHARAHGLRVLSS